MRRAAVNLVSATLLAACGGAPEAVRNTCDVPGWGVVTSEASEAALPCDTVRLRFRLADEAVRNLEPLSFREGVPVHIIEARCLWLDGDQCTDGYTENGAVRLGVTLEALAHEFFHLADEHHGNLGSRWHDGWEGRGYLEAAARYEALFDRDGNGPR